MTETNQLPRLVGPAKFQYKSKLRINKSKIQFAKI
jgi:hypothetical protein